MMYINWRVVLVVPTSGSAGNPGEAVVVDDGSLMLPSVPAFWTRPETLVAMASESGLEDFTIPSPPTDSSTRYEPDGIVVMADGASRSLLGWLDTLFRVRLVIRSPSAADTENKAPTFSSAVSPPHHTRV